MLSSIKNHNPSVYKQPFYKFHLTLSSFLFQIALPSASSHLPSIPNLQQCAEHHIPQQSVQNITSLSSLCRTSHPSAVCAEHHIPQQSVQKQQHCNISYFSHTFTLLSLVLLIVLYLLHFMEFCGPYL